LQGWRLSPSLETLQELWNEIYYSYGYLRKVKASKGQAVPPSQKFLNNAASRSVEQIKLRDMQCVFRHHSWINRGSKPRQSVMWQREICEKNTKIFLLHRPKFQYAFIIHWLIYWSLHENGNWISANIAHQVAKLYLNLFKL